MSTELPLEVLGLLAPVLGWVEGAEGVRLPEGWRPKGLGVEERERAWLTRELPTYSQDNLDEIRRLARDPMLMASSGARLQRQKRPPRKRSFMAPPRNYDLSDVFKRLCERYFDWNGNELCIRTGYVEELHELALRFPIRHLVRHRHARAVAAGLLTVEHALRLTHKMSLVPTTSQGIRAVVERGLTEGHLHLWGVIGADETWADQILGNVSPDALGRYRPEERRLLILSRAAARMLALALLHRHLGLEGSKLPYEMVTRLDDLYRAPPGPPEQRARLALRRLFRKTVHDTGLAGHGTRLPPAACDWLLPMVDPAVHYLFQCRRRRAGDDPIPGLASLRRRLELVDRLHFEVHLQLVRLTLPSVSLPALGRRAWTTGREDSPLRRFLHAVFFRYLIYNTHHRNLSTQNGKTTGLRRFKEYFGASQRRHLAGDLEVQSLVLEQLRGSVPLQAVEARVSPPRAGAVELAPWLAGSACNPEWRHLKKFGLIIHFLKQDHRDLETERRTRSIHTLRHRHVRYATRRRAMEVLRLLSTPHPVVPFIVGIDAANLELTTPPEVFAPSFRFLREFPIELRQRSVFGRRLAASGEIAELVTSRRLGMTYHVGEEFRHLLSGLRAIHEVIRFLRPRPGDRLGHALALALSPEVWAAQIGYQAVLPKLEWLDTLVWVRHLLGPGHPLLGELGIEDTIQRLSREIYQPPAGRGRLSTQPAVLYDAWLLRQLDPTVLDRNELKRGEAALVQQTLQGDQQRRWRRVQRRVLREIDREIGSNDAFRLLERYWYDAGVRKNDADDAGVRERGDEIIAVDLRRQRRRWIEICLEAQARLRKIVERLQIVIEINLSSNRVIGPMHRFAEHPIFRATLDEEGRLQREIRMTVNTDDPGVFSTSLVHEYYLLAEILLDRGVAEPEVVEWLEWLRRCGEDYSFLRSLPDLQDPRVRKIVQDLEKMYPSLRRRLCGEARSLRKDRDAGASP